MQPNRAINDLVQVGALSRDRLVPIGNGTRDSPIQALRDYNTDVIVLSEELGGIHSAYQEAEDDPVSGSARSSEHNRDTIRRLQQYSYLAEDRHVLDFRCGDGSFLRKVQPLARSVSGVELRKSAVLELNQDGIDAFSRLGELPRQVDTVFMFHVLEHLPRPLATLEEVRSRMSGKDSYLVVEVPSARDLLIKLQCTAFINFTLWSQHLVLHTRESLKLLLQGTGFEVESVIGVQRYPLSNHFRWLADGLPGGHLGPLAAIDTEPMVVAYGQALAAIDATDTIVALARPSH